MMSATNSYLKMAAVCCLEPFWGHQRVGPIKNHSAESLKQVGIEKSQVFPRHIPKGKVEDITTFAL